MLKNVITTVVNSILDTTSIMVKEARNSAADFTVNAFNELAVALGVVKKDLDNQILAAITTLRSEQQTSSQALSNQVLSTSNSLDSRITTLDSKINGIDIEELQALAASINQSSASLTASKDEILNKIAALELKVDAMLPIDLQGLSTAQWESYIENLVASEINSVSSI